MVKREGARLAAHGGERGRWLCAEVGEAEALLGGRLLGRGGGIDIKNAAFRKGRLPDDIAKFWG